MNTLLEQLDDASLLLMYQSGELNAEGRKAVERRLDAEPQLRELLESLSKTDERLASTFASAEAREPVVLPARVKRSLAAETRQWQADRAREQDATPESSLRFPWWSYPLVAAASLFVIISVLAGFLRFGPTEYAAPDSLAVVGPVPPDITEVIPEGTIFAFLPVRVDEEIGEPIDELSVVADIEREMALLESSWPLGSDDYWSDSF